MPKYLVLKGQKILRRLRRREKKAIYTLTISFYGSFKKQFFEKITKNFAKPDIAKFLRFLAFLRTNFSKISLKFS